MSFLAMMEAAKTSSSVVLDTGWRQGRSSFGGLIASLLVAHLSSKVPSNSILRSLNVSYVGPIDQDEIHIESSVLRSGKSVTHAQAQVVLNGQVMVTLTAAYGSRRDSTVEKLAPLMTPPPDSSSGRPFPFIPKLMSECLKHYEMVWLEGEFPFSSQAEPDFSGYVRYRDRSEPFSLEKLVAMVDAWPSSVLPMLDQPAPSSTMTWNLELLVEHVAEDSEAWWHYQVKTDQAIHGYAHAEARVHDHRGTLVAISRQTVTVFG